MWQSQVPAEPGTVPLTFLDTSSQEGGNSSLVLEGGLVPKGLYMTEGGLEKEGCPLTEDSIYHSVSLGRGQVHEVLVSNDDPGSVITWDFDVMRQDVMFTVFRTRIPVPAQSPTVVLYGCETMREEQRLRVFENKVLRKIFGAKRDEVTGEWRKWNCTHCIPHLSYINDCENCNSKKDTCD
ncbi:hypothetical protein ANN_06717 [Periplaneta americana]|uniref:Uncharacterized protein n=1 Tax=Periplaneta americana TaxID=6978 RepID=A0ABQ8TG50_PERAM|nr:hypothetical protein ANN_06717 [Periplaneta americana]